MGKPLILVTNDDGITAPGIRALVEVSKEWGEVLVVAPDSPQSGMGHAITVNNPLRLRKIDDFHNVTAYSCSGTPVDCIKLAIYEVLKRKPNICLSGINHGNNCSTNILYSGTMSAAVEGSMEGIHSAGFSLLSYDYSADLSSAKEIVGKIVEEMVSSGLPKGVCLNVNIPEGNEIKGIKVCRQAKAYWEDEFETRKDPFGKEYHWLTGEFKNYDGGEDTDYWALENNYVSVVPIQYDMTAHHAIQNINEWKL